LSFPCASVAACSAGMQRGGMLRRHVALARLHACTHARADPASRAVRCGWELGDRNAWHWHWQAVAACSASTRNHHTRNHHAGTTGWQAGGQAGAVGSQVRFIDWDLGGRVLVRWQAPHRGARCRPRRTGPATPPSAPRDPLTFRAAHHSRRTRIVAGRGAAGAFGAAHGLRSPPPASAFSHACPPLHMHAHTHLTCMAY
jgi:hypothetical protein